MIKTTKREGLHPYKTATAIKGPVDVARGQMYVMTAATSVIGIMQLIGPIPCLSGTVLKIEEFAYQGCP